MRGLILSKFFYSSETWGRSIMLLSGVCSVTELPFIGHKPPCKQHNVSSSCQPKITGFYYWISAGMLFFPSSLTVWNVTGSSLKLIKVLQQGIPPGSLLGYHLGLLPSTCFFWQSLSHSAVQKVQKYFFFPPPSLLVNQRHKGLVNSNFHQNWNLNLTLVAKVFKSIL